MTLPKLPTPKPGFIWVRKAKVEDPVTKKLIIPENVDLEESGFAVGVVTAVGANYLNYKMQTKVGQEVLISKPIFAQSDRFVRVDGVQHFLVNEMDYFFATL